MESEEVVTCCASTRPVLVHSKPSSAMMHHARHSSLDLRGHHGPGIARAVTPPSSSSSHMPRKQQHQRNLSLDSAMRVLSPSHHSDTTDRHSLASDDSGIFNSDDGDRTSRVNMEASTPALLPCTLRPPVQGVIDEVRSPVSPLQEASTVDAFGSL
ncbi:hypothetical protein HPB52_006665 [Rhipicephalus sanguineus]|uniref:Uncharacterized protein n=1 Tax=Rhipicephalus sanguineus TaxID=34632 RepID=A0A9D4STT7_RHISA|nr:hypothetical protein HPB52_006665 [Rhipicephalus sanguineus]